MCFWFFYRFIFFIELKLVKINSVEINLYMIKTYIPDRQKEGYGPNINSFKKLIESLNHLAEKYKYPIIFSTHFVRNFRPSVPP
mgnify:CR=1 FL=1